MRLKVYGTTQGEKRIIRKGKAIAVARDSKGRFKSVRKWSPKRPIKKAHYKEIYVEARNGKEAINETLKVAESCEWVPNIECWPYPKIGAWLETCIKQ